MVDTPGPQGHAGEGVAVAAAAAVVAAGVVVLEPVPTALEA